MANYYSDHFTATAGGTSVDDPRIKVPSGVNHGAIRYKRATVTTAAAVTDDEICVFFDMKTGDRIHALYFSATAMTGTTMTADLGVYDEDLVLKDLDLFCAAATAPLTDLTTAVARTDMFIKGALEDQDRGKTLWELVKEGTSGSDTSDPLETWKIALTMNTETLVTAGNENVLEVYYTSDGN